jgi:uncharacterized protein (DUF1499 family)
MPLKLMQKLFSLFISLTLVLALLLGIPNPANARLTSRPIVSTSFPSTLLPMALLSFSGKRPDYLGVNAGQFAPCPNSPNCVSSQSSDPDHRVEPLTYSSSPELAFQQLKTAIQSLESTKIVTETENYLYVEFTSALMGFVDDVEFYLNKDKNAIEVRSASRLGESDLGVNRKRVESIRAMLLDLGAKA